MGPRNSAAGVEEEKVGRRQVYVGAVSYENGCEHGDSLCL